jgi:hypothetical protein
MLVAQSEQGSPPIPSRGSRAPVGAAGSRLKRSRSGAWLLCTNTSHLLETTDVAAACSMQKRTGRQIGRLFIDPTSGLGEHRESPERKRASVAHDVRRPFRTSSKAGSNPYWLGPELTTALRQPAVDATARRQSKGYADPCCRRVQPARSAERFRDWRDRAPPSCPIAVAIRRQ